MMGLIPKKATPNQKRMMENYLNLHLSQAEEVGFFLASKGHTKVPKGKKIGFRNGVPVFR